MKIVNIEFLKLLKINDDISLDFNKSLSNHINTFHAGVLYTLGETKSGIYLQEIFKDKKDEVDAILRESKVKYKKTANSKIFSSASVSEINKNKFLKNYEKRKKALIEVDVKLKDIHNNIIFIGSYIWYISKKDN